MYDTIVVGGGIVGASTAYHLARHGIDTLLIDRRDQGRATDAGAGIVSPESSRHASDQWYRFAVDAAGYYPALCDLLRADDVESIGFGRPGVLVVDLPFHDRQPFADARERVFDRQATHGSPPDSKLYDVPPDRAKSLFPALGEVRDAYYYEDGARVNGRIFETALRQASTEYGLNTANATVTELLITDDAVSGVQTGRGEYRCEDVVLAGGAWSKEFADQLDVAIPVAPQRGQIIHLETNQTTETWPIVSTVAGHYLVPWPDGSVAAGATRETGSGFAPLPTAGGVRQVLDDALRTAPGIAQATLAEIRVGLRPLSDDGLPLIGPVETVSGVYLATGHGPTGLTLGPYTGKCVADLIAEGSTPSTLSPFSPTRFT